MGELVFSFGRNTFISAIAAIAMAGTAFSASRLESTLTPDVSGANTRAPGLNSLPVLADHNGDGLADGLAALLANTKAGDTINVVVLMDPDGSVGKAQEAVGGFQLRHSYTLINGFSASVNAGQARALSKIPFVTRVEPVYTVRANLEAARTDTGVDPMREAPAGTGTYGRGAGVTICIVDTGIQHDHEVFVSLATGFSKITHGYYGISGANKGPTTDMALLFDGNGHGTHVASIAAGDGDGDGFADDGFAAALPGIAPDANILPVKVLNSAGFGTDDDVVGGVEWCAQQPEVDVINLSISGDAQQSDGLDAMSQMVNAAVQAGKVVVAGAGNSDYPNDIRPPAAAHLAISVGAYGEWSRSLDLEDAAHAIDLNQGGNAQLNAIQSFYSRGPYTAWFSTRGATSDGRVVPDVVAPGHSVIAATSKAEANCDRACYLAKSGTSMATPVVSGIAALVIAANPDLNPDQVRQIIFDTAEHRGPSNGGNPQKSRHWGFGMIDAYAAVSKAREMAGDFSIGPSQTLFPSNYQIGEGAVDRGLSTSVNFTVTDTSTPLTIMLTAPENASVQCYILYLFYEICEVRPDLDIFLYKISSGGETSVADSQCPGIGEHCNYELQYGLQETISIGSPTAGDYRLEVRFLNATATPADMTSATFTYQISQGPLAIASGDGVINPPPVAVAGDDYDSPTTLITLDGSGSSDNGTIKLYAWQWAITGGADDGRSGNSSAVTPTLDVTVEDGGTLHAKLTVVDELGASASDEIIVTVGGANLPPIADAGGDSGNYSVKLPKGRNATASINLNGSASFDPNDDPLSYLWVRVGTTDPSWTTATANVAGLTQGMHMFQLTVDDGRLGTDNAIACVEVYKGKIPEGLCPTPSVPTPPLASFSYTCTELDCDFTDMSALTNGDPITSWAWDFGDTGSSTLQNPSHTYGGAGSYTVELTATDKDGSNSTSQSITVSVAGSIVLSSSGHKTKGIKIIDLNWGGATTDDVDIYRDGAFVVTTANDGVYSDDTGDKGGGSYVSKVCEAGSTSICSNNVTTVF